MRREGGMVVGEREGKGIRRSAKSDKIIAPVSTDRHCYYNGKGVVE